MKVCCLFNIAPLYREAIYTLMDRDRRVDFDFLVGDRPAPKENIALLDCPGKLEGFRKKYLRNLYRGPKLVWQRGAIRKALGRRYDAYILTGNTGILSNWLICLGARLLRRPVWLWAHGLRGDEQGLELRKNYGYMRLAGRLFLYGDRARELAVLQGFAPRRITVVYNSLDYDTQLALRSRTGDNAFIRNYFGNDAPLVCFVGRLTAVKQLALLLDALALIGPERRPNLVLVGDGPERDALQVHAEALGLADTVWFYGECYDQGVIASLLTHSDVCVSPGNVGLTAMHAMMFGTPVVTHDNPLHQCPEAEAVADGLTGSLFSEGDAASLAAQIERWTGLDDDHRDDVRQACFRTMEERYNPHRQLEKMIGTLFEQTKG